MDKKQNNRHKRQTAANARFSARRLCGGWLLGLIFIVCGNASCLSANSQNFKDFEPCRYLTLAAAEDLAGRPLKLIWTSAPSGKDDKKDFANAPPPGRQSKWDCVYAEPRDDYQNESVTQVSIELIDFADEPEADGYLKRVTYGYQQFSQKTAARLGDDSITIHRGDVVEVVVRKSDLVILVKVIRFDERETSVGRVEGAAQKVLDNLAAK